MKYESKFRFGLWKKGQLPLTEILKDSFKVKDPDIGALTFFIGVVRRDSRSREVKGLKLEAYEEVVLDSFKKIASQIREKHSVSDVRIHHVLGDLTPGDLIMLVLVSGCSRKSSLDALRETVERVKSEAPLWKKETLISGESYWVEYD